MLNSSWFRINILDLACSMGHDTCLNEAGARFKKWIEAPENRPNPDLKSVIYYYGMQTVGTEEDWDVMFDLFVKEQGDAEPI